ncbi:von Willebrand factor type A domain protein, partial [Ancylostoma caninum]
LIFNVVSFQTPGVNCFAVDSSPSTDVRALKAFTGSAQRVYPYERNAEFARQINKMASAADNPKCQFVLGAVRERVHAAAGVEVRPAVEWVYSTLGPVKIENPVQRDILGEPLNIEKLSEGKVDYCRGRKHDRLSGHGQQLFEPRLQHLLRQRRPQCERPPPLGCSRDALDGLPIHRRNRLSGQRVSVQRLQQLQRCLLDVIVVLDSSGSVEETFRREKELAAGIVSRFRIGPNNARVSIIKFAGSQKVKTVWSFADVQSKGKILRVLDSIPFSSGTTAIHSALLKALSEYTSDHGARPGRARPIAIVFTDGFGQKSTFEEAAMLRAVIPDTFAIAINHNFPISRPELEVIVGQPQRVFTDANIGKFHDVLETIANDCIID